MQVTLFIQSFELPSTGFNKQFKLNSELYFCATIQLDIRVRNIVSYSYGI